MTRGEAPVLSGSWSTLCPEQGTLNPVTAGQGAFLVESARFRPCVLMTWFSRLIIKLTKIVKLQVLI